jgi:putative ABC transport system permease protein
MKDAFRLALAYMRYYIVRTLILMVCITIALLLPAAVNVLVKYYNRVMIDRAESTPLILGAPGSPGDLVMNTLYFRGRVDRRLNALELKAAEDAGLVTVIPLHVGYTAQKVPVIGTSLDYFAFRNLRTAAGTLPQVLGDVVLGAAAARSLGMRTGDRLLSDQEKLYDISSTYPLRMKVTGVLADSRSPDDHAVFVDLKTAWVIEGIGHGHQAAETMKDPDLMIQAIGHNLVMSGAVVEYNEITGDNIDSYHFHGDPEHFPVSAMICVPPDVKSGTIFKARYFQNESVQAVVPARVVGELMDIVFRVKQFFDANFIMVLVSTSLFLVLVILLTVRIRRREFETLFKIGCARSTVAAIQVAELVLILAVSLVLAVGLLGGLFWYVVHVNMLLTG